MTKEWIEKEKQGIKALKYLEERCETLAKSIKKSIDKSKTERKENFETSTQRYKNLEELEEAYGFGEITTQEYDDLRDGFEKFDEKLEDIYKYKEKALHMLYGFIDELRTERIETQKEMKKR